MFEKNEINIGTVLERRKKKKKIVKYEGDGDRNNPNESVKETMEIGGSRKNWNCFNKSKVVIGLNRRGCES